jgi:Lrp/AsnC family transcriptional regulator, leucine-responsive regulatory protein
MKNTQQYAMSTQTIELDRIDRQILQLLQTDAHMTYQDIAQAVSLSASPCLRRIKRLEEAGVIKQYVALLDPQKLGLGLLAYVSVKLEKRGAQALENFSAAVLSWPEVVACYAMTGDMDYLLRVHTTDLDHFSRVVMDRIMRRPEVLDVKSSFALQRIKDTTALPA